MFLVELVLQGIRGFQQLARVRFQGGFNFVAAGNEAGKTTAVDTIIRLLHPVNQPGKMETLVSRIVPDASRGALVVFTDDSSYYRVIQDFSKRAVNLSKFNPGTKEFTLMHKDWDSTAQFMAGLLPGVSEDDYARLFVFRRESCSGQQPQGLPASPAARERPRPPGADGAGRCVRPADPTRPVRCLAPHRRAGADAPGMGLVGAVPRARGGGRHGRTRAATREGARSVARPSGSVLVPSADQTRGSHGCPCSPGRPPARVSLRGFTSRCGCHGQRTCGSTASPPEGDAAG